MWLRSAIELISFVAVCVSKPSAKIREFRGLNNHSLEEFHLFEDDILLTRDDLMLLHLLLPPGDAFDEANGLDSEMTEDGFMPFQEKRQVTQQRRKKRAATAIASKLWMNATIPYTIGKSVTETVKEHILQAMNHWQSNTCIRFVERESEENFVLFERGPCGCCSYVGRKGVGVQEVTLSPQCASYGVVIHELGHVIGFWHEHSRPDRDQFVKILRENVILEKLENFDIKTAIEIDSLGEQYDYESVMHYRKRTFSRNGFDTMNTTMPGVKIGQRRGLSPGDIAQTRLLYNCPKPRCHEEFDSIENSFTSPNYPQKYFRDYECTWVIHVLPGEIVTLEFIDFALERSGDCSYDYLEIREGYDVHGNLVGRMCGEGVPGTFQVLDSVWINFVADSEHNFRGFWAHYFKTVIYPESGSGEADESGDLPIGVNTRMSGQPSSIYMANCNQLLREVTGSVSSPLMPFMYVGQPIECSWTIDGGLNASRIQLTIMNKIPEGKGSPERCLGDVYMAPRRKTAANKHMDKKADKAIRNRTETHTNNSGSRLKTTVVNYNCHQQNTLLLASHRVSIQWSSKLNQAIAFSYIIDYDECRFSPSPCDHLCENTLTAFVCSCNPGHFLNDDQRSCSVKVLPPVSDKCGEIIVSERGSINGTRDCSWYIRPREDLRVFLTFVKFFIPPGISSHTCLENYVEIQVGKNQTSRVKYCDRRLPPALALPPGNVMIRLRTKFNRLGIQPQFTANYLFYKNTASDCQQKIKDYGEIVYPKYSKEYGPHTLCTWYVSGRRGVRLRLHFVEMDIERTDGCHFDFVEVRSGHHPTSPLIGRFCGQTQPADVVTGGQMLVMFASDGNGSGRGFKATVMLEKRRRKTSKGKKKKVTVSASNGAVPQPHSAKQSDHREVRRLVN